MTQAIQKLVQLLDSKSFKSSYSISNVTTLRIGGPADIFYFSNSISDLIQTYKKAIDLEIPIHIIGGGSNILVSDSGLRGLVIKPLFQNISILEESGTLPVKTYDKYRWDSDTTKGSFKGIEFKDLDFDESDKPRVKVLIESGAALHKSIYSLLAKGITGLQWYAGIPGTLGGAIFNNVHGGTHFISEVLDEVLVLSKNGDAIWLNGNELDFLYDESTFHKNKYVILAAKLNLFKGDVPRARKTADEWFRRKLIQPRNSAGCVFRNLTNDEKNKFGFPTTSTGYVIEHVLKMTGYSVGDAKISEVNHNFIVNTGKASASDYFAIVVEVSKRIKDTLGIIVKPEIIFHGFNDCELESLYR